MNKLEKMFEKYAEEGENMDAVEAVRLLVRAYMKECGVSIGMRTVLYVAGEDWLFERLPQQSNNPLTEEQMKEEQRLIHLMPFFCEEFDPDYYRQWDICGGRDLVQGDETVEQAYKRICLIAVKEKRYDDATLRAFCWAIKNEPVFAEQYWERQFKELCGDQGD